MHFLIEIGQHKVNITHYIFKNILIKKKTTTTTLNKILFKESKLSFTANRLKGIDFTLYSLSRIEYFIRSCWPLPEPCKHPLHHIHFNIITPNNYNLSGILLTNHHPVTHSLRFIHTTTSHIHIVFHYTQFFLH